MAKKPTQPAADSAEDDILGNFSPDPSDIALDDAIDDLRGVLKNDADGTVPDLGGGDFDFNAGGAADLSQFGGDFGGGDFGGGAGSDFGASTGGGFGADSFGAGAFGGGAASHPAGSALTSNLDLIMDIPIDVQIVLGNSHMHVATLMNLAEGATIALDRRIGDPVEVIVNGRLIGRGEITVLEEDNTRFGVRMIEVLAVKR